MKTLTKQQQISLKQLYDSNNSGFASYRAFRRTVKQYFGGYAGVVWSGIFIGIEKDGYRHS